MKLLRPQEEIGAGEFGNVYRGTWKENGKQIPVAMKTLKVCVCVWVWGGGGRGDVCVCVWGGGGDVCVWGSVGVSVGGCIDAIFLINIIQIVFVCSSALILCL